MRRRAVAALAVALLVGLPPPGVFADPVCATAELRGTDVPDETVHRCAPTPFPVTCRYVEAGLAPRAETRVTLCPPRA